MRIPILIAIAISVLLFIAGIGVGTAYWLYNDLSDVQPKQRAAMAKLVRLDMAIDEFRMDLSRVPVDLLELIESSEQQWNGPYINRTILNDPWERNYQYFRLEGLDSYILMTRGADGAPGGWGVDNDQLSPGSAHVASN